MTGREIELKKIIDALELPFILECPMDLYLIESAIHLLQEGGYNLGYDYQWSVMKRPKSPTLRKDLESIDIALRMGEDESKNFELPFLSKCKTTKLRLFIKRIGKDNRLKLAWELEKLSTTIFLIRNGLAFPFAEDVAKKSQGKMDVDEAREALRVLRWELGIYW